MGEDVPEDRLQVCVCVEGQSQVMGLHPGPLFPDHHGAGGSLEVGD